MVISKIMGGLGNQMFQYAAGLSLSIDRGEILFLDISPYINYDKRKFQLDGFPEIRRRIQTGEVRIFGPGDHVEAICVRDDFMTFSFPECNVYLDGYWQSERFFHNNADLIRREFALPGSVAPGIQDSVSVHVRRTDYLNSNGFHPVLPPSYYDAAMSAIGGGRRAFVFSDDIEWCRTGLESPHFVGAEFVSGGDEFHDLRLMSSAAHNIIANSSFSWWGAWLNQTPGRTVVAPRTWFGDVSGIDSSNMLPGGWVTI